MTKKLLIIIPCFNEAPNLGPLLNELTAVNLDFDVLVIDDGSSDDTYAVAIKKTSVIRLSVNCGIGATVQTGIQYAKQNGYRLCMQLDGDGQHPPSEIIKFLTAYNLGNSPLIIGSRFLESSAYLSTIWRRLGIYVLRGLFFFLYSVKITDPTSGFRMFDEKLIRLFANDYPYDYPEPISIAMCLEHGIVPVEIPVQMRERATGKSSIHGVKTLIYMLKVVFQIILIKINRFL